jgi:PKD repeat protein
VFTRDTEPPVITLSAAASLPNNPTDAQIAGAFGLATVSDNCTSAAVVQESIGPEQVTGCARSVTKTWTATDAAGNASSVSQTINFARDTQPPSIAALSGPVAPIPVGSSASISTTVSDECSGVGSVTVDWGDGGKSTIANPSSAFSTAHIYSTPGIYAVHLSATDRSGNEAGADFRYVVVYDPASGSATGGGMITSKAGSYLPNPSLTGKAIFAFVCKYRNGSSLPVGQTFFRANELNFHSDSYAWLIISGGRAQFKGQGTLNGVAGYSFVVTVQDGKACGGAGDKFRLELWNGSQKIYDNVWDAPDSLDTGTLEDISQGSIVLH